MTGFRRVVFLLGCFLLVLTLPMHAAVGVVADLGRDWSNTMNAPNGWSYNTGTTPFSSNFSNWMALGQPAWAPGNVIGNFIPACFKAISDYRTGGIDMGIGDVGVHSTDNANGGSNGIVNVTWTSTVSAMVTISGSIWNADLVSGRDNTYNVKLNGTSLATGTVTPGVDTRSKPVNFSFIRSINVGDVIEFDIAKPASQSNGTWAGITLTITTVSQTMILPQFVFGGGWYSALYFTNTGTDGVAFPVNFFASDGTPLSVPGVGGPATLVSLAGRGTAILEAPNTGPFNQGYVSVALPGGVAGYGVFRQSVPGQPDQEAVVPFSRASSTTSTLIWDETNFMTGVAIANLGPGSSVTVVARDAQGRTVGTCPVAVPANGRVAVALRAIQCLSGIAGSRGSADFSVSIGNVAVLGLRFYGTAFTSIPTTDR